MTIKAVLGRYAEDEMRIPEWTLGDRLSKALSLSHLSVGVMAEALGVSRQTVGRWMSDRTNPKPATVYLWATACGVDYEWLLTGTPSADASRIVIARKLVEVEQRACRDSNPKPSDP